ncbi:MAG: sulfide/dihydroorotate dehydrogenase-like FAD/NAD-binding protein [Bacillota bacterium]
MDRLECIDAGSEYCPCYLAEVNECITCSHLQGKNYCDCNWRGVCIYQEYTWCGNKKKNVREEVNAEIVERKEINHNAILMKIKVSKTLARQLKQPGSYIFVRDAEKPKFFDTPMSIMHADEQNGLIEIAIQIVGAKSKALLNCKDKIVVKGPYWNGLIGIKNLKTLKEKNVLVVARGIALAPAVLAIEYFIKNKNHVTFFMDPGRIENIFINSYIQDLPITKIQINLRRGEGLRTVTEMIEGESIDLIYSGGADKLHRILLEKVERADKKIDFVSTNNHEICCGEGICGACCTYTNEGELVKMCKTQVDIHEVM